MNDHIAGKMEEFMEWSKKELIEIKCDVRALNQFKWRIAGGAAVLSVVLTALVEAAHIYVLGR